MAPLSTTTRALVRASCRVSGLFARHLPLLSAVSNARRHISFTPRRPWLPLRINESEEAQVPTSLLSSSFNHSRVHRSAATGLHGGIPATDVLMRDWNATGQHRQTVALFEALSKDEALKPGVAAEYVRALAALNALPTSSSMAGSRLRLQNGAAATGLLPPEFRFKLDDSGTPLKVSVKGMGSSTVLLRDLVKYLLTVVFALSALSLIVEGAAQNLPKGLGLGGNGAIKPHIVTDSKTRFSDVKGCDEAKAELQEIIEYLKDPKKFTRLGAKLPKGVLLSGPPGTGKTLLARATAGEASVPFIQACGSEFEEMFVGVGARRIRDLFAAARKAAPAIIFIDEVDAVGSKRAHKENTSVRMTLNQLLVELDGFEQNEGLVVLCATNFPEALDPALTRPGRLDKTVVVPLPDLKGRQEILELYGSRVVLGKSVDLNTLARRTAGMTGADLFNVVNIAAVRSSAEGKNEIDIDAVEDAFDRVVLGLERRSPLSEEERKMTAIHEGGHAIVSLHTHGADPLYKATIMPRGNALGVTWQLPKGDKYSQRLFELKARLDVLMGGKAAEILFYGHSDASAGCASDLRNATSLARQMVMTYGMGTESPVPQTIDADSYGALSPDLRRDVDAAVQKLLDDSYHRAVTCLEARKDDLQRLADALVEYETLTAEEISLAVNGRSAEIAELREAQAEARKQAGFLSKIQLLKKSAAAALTSDDNSDHTAADTATLQGRPDNRSVAGTA